MNEQRRNVARTFVYEGERYARTTLKGANLLRPLVFGRLHELVGDPDGDRLLMPGVRSYTDADYEVARGWFRRCIDAHPEIEGELSTQLAFCERVLAVVLDQRDIEHLEVERGRGRRLARVFRRGSVTDQVRCKWCGHYTPYVDPGEGFGYLNSNNCERCGWSYPAPHFLWDSLDGLAYSYYRGSMGERGFYDWFEENFRVENKTTWRGG